MFSAVTRFCACLMLGGIAITSSFAQTQVRAHWEIRHYFLEEGKAKVEVFLDWDDGSMKKILVFFGNGSASSDPQTDRQWVVQYENAVYGYHFLRDKKGFRIVKKQLQDSDDREDDASSQEVAKGAAPNADFSFDEDQDLAAKTLYDRRLSLMKPRMHGDDVWALQRFLVENGYDEVGDIDGWFGPNTEKAVKHFQTDHHLNADGVVTRAVWDALSGQMTGDFYTD
jgi:hypothetical protein